MGISEGDQAYALDQADAGVGALQEAHQALARVQHQLPDVPVRVALRLQGTPLMRPVDLIREHIQQHLHRRTHDLCKQAQLSKEP